jgi:hypothetical protein
MYAEFWWENLKEKRPLRRPRHRRNDDNKTDLKVIVWNNVNWINLAPARDQWQLCEHANRLQPGISGNSVNTLIGSSQGSVTALVNTPIGSSQGSVAAL